jgi:hypothetical protein
MNSVIETLFKNSNFYKIFVFIDSNYYFLFYFILFLLLLFLILKKKYNYILVILSIEIGILLSSFVYINFFFDYEAMYYDKRSVNKTNTTDLALHPIDFLPAENKYDDEKYSVKNFKKNIYPLKFPLSLAPNSTFHPCIENEGWVLFKTDKFGFRNENAKWLNSNFNIAIVGDSYAQGYCVKKTINDYLDNYGLKSVNIASGGNGPLISYAVTTEFLNRFKVDYIYELVVLNDFIRYRYDAEPIDFEKELKDKDLKNYIDIDKYSVDYFNEKNLLSFKKFSKEYSTNLLSNYKKDSNYMQYVNNLFTGKLLFKYILRSLALGLNKKISSYDIKKLSSADSLQLDKTYTKFANLNNSKVIFVILPDKPCYSSVNWDKALLFVQNTLEKSIKNEKIIFPKELCDPKNYALKNKFSGHYNDIGYALLSEIIFNDYMSRKRSE